MCCNVLLCVLRRTGRYQEKVHSGATAVRGNVRIQA